MGHDSLTSRSSTLLLGSHRCHRSGINCSPSLDHPPFALFFLKPTTMHDPFPIPPLPWLSKAVQPFADSPPHDTPFACARSAHLFPRIHIHQPCSRASAL